MMTGKETRDKGKGKITFSVVDETKGQNLVHILQFESMENVTVDDTN